MPTVVNFKQFGSIAALNRAFGSRWTHIGRANPRYNLSASPLANPFRRHDCGNRPGATLPRYRRRLWDRIQAGDTAVLDALRAIDQDTVLVCWCAPGPCHGAVVAAAVAWLRGQDRP